MVVPLAFNLDNTKLNGTTGVSDLDQVQFRHGSVFGRIYHVPFEGRQTA